MAISVVRVSPTLSTTTHNNQQPTANSQQPTTNTHQPTNPPTHQPTNQPTTELMDSGGSCGGSGQRLRILWGLVLFVMLLVGLVGRMVLVLVGISLLASMNVVMSCHVMSCHVMSCHVMSCHVMSCHVMSCHVMSHVMSCHVMSCHVNATRGAQGSWQTGFCTKPAYGMGCHGFSVLFLVRWPTTSNNATSPATPRRRSGALQFIADSSNCTTKTQCPSSSSCTVVYAQYAVH